MTSSKKGVLFDLDGTLIDSAPDLHNCINKVLVNNNKQKVPFSKCTIYHIVLVTIETSFSKL